MVVSVCFASIHHLRLFRRQKRHPDLIWSDLDQQSEHDFKPTSFFRLHGMFVFTSNWLHILFVVSFFSFVFFVLFISPATKASTNWMIGSSAAWRRCWKLCRCTQGSICRFPPPHSRTNESALIWLHRTFSTVKAKVFGWFSSLHSYFFLRFSVAMMDLNKKPKNSIIIPKPNSMYSFLHSSLIVGTGLAHWRAKSQLVWTATKATFSECETFTFDECDANANSQTGCPVPMSQTAPQTNAGLWNQPEGDLNLQQSTFSVTA